MLVQSRPASPAFSQSSRGTMPTRSHAAWWGTISASTKRRTWSRNSSWSEVRTLRMLGVGSWGGDAPAAADVEGLAGRVAGGFGEEVFDGGGDLVRSAGPLHRHGRHQRYLAG